MPQTIATECQHYCGHCLFPIKAIEPVAGVQLICPDCATETTYGNCGRPLSIKLPDMHVCNHAIHHKGLRFLLLVHAKRYGCSRRRSFGGPNYVPLLASAVV